MKLNELVILQEIVERELSTAKERTIFLGKTLSAKQKQMDTSEDDEEIEALQKEIKSIRAELQEARVYETKVNNITTEISEREFSIL